MAKKEVKQWITVKGVHIPIYEGQSKEEAVKAALEKKKSAGPISKATRGKKIDEHTKKTTEYASAVVKRELAEKNYKNAKKSGSEDRIRTMDRALDYAKDREKQKYREVIKAYNRADEAREKKAYEEVKFGKKVKGIDANSLSRYGYDPSDVTGDPTVITSDAGDFYKIGKNKWSQHSKQGRALGGTYTDVQVAEKLKGAKNVKISPSAKNNAQENTFQNRQSLKNEIDAYVKAHPNPNAEDRKKVSEMRDRYNAMLKESMAKTKAKAAAALAEERKQNAKKKELEELKKEHYKLSKYGGNVPGHDAEVAALEKKIYEMEQGSDFGNAEDRTDRMKIYRDQLQEVQEDIKQFESTSPRLRAPDYDQKLAALKKKEADLQSYIDRDTKPAKSSTPEFKSRQEAEEFYRNKFAGVSSTYANKMAKKLGIEGRGKDKREALAKHYADQWETKSNISKNEAEKEKQIARNEAERKQAEKAFAHGQISPEEMKGYGFTDKEIESIKKAGREEALQKVVQGKNTTQYIDPMGNINQKKTKSTYERNYGEDFTNMSKSNARLEIAKMNDDGKTNHNIIDGKDITKLSDEEVHQLQTNQWKYKLTELQRDALNKEMKSRGYYFEQGGWHKNSKKPDSRDTSQMHTLTDEEHLQNKVTELNDLHDAAWKHGADTDAIKSHIKTVMDGLPDGTVLARVKQNTSTQYTSRGAIQSQNTEISKLYKINGKWSKYKDGSGQIDDITSTVIYNSGKLQTLDNAKKEAAEKQKGDYIQTKGYGVKEKWQATNEERNAAIAAERAGGLSLEDAERKVDRMSPEQIRKLAGSQSKQAAPKKISPSQVTVSDSDYRFSAGKAPKGYGNWAFYLGNSDEPIFFNGSYAEAKKKAIKEAANRGVNKIRVGS